MDTQRYLANQEEVNLEDNTTNMRFLSIDCGPLKQTLVSHCQAWVSKLTGLLHHLATTELKTLLDYFKCAPPPAAGHVHG